MNPFEPYLPCYPAGTVPERPWWRYGLRFIRSDGAERLIPLDDGARDIDALDAYDAAHPLPVPPVLTGQVWALPNGSTYSIRAMPPPSVVEDQFIGDVPIGQCCLVWGPLAPWAPKGWRP